jgi:hypothetical protein
MPEQPNLFVHAAMSDLVDGSARDFRLVSGARSDLGTLIGGPELRKAADTDAELTASLSQARQALSTADQAAAAWQRDLAAATQHWEASLAELARLHPDDIPLADA